MRRLSVGLALLAIVASPLSGVESRFVDYLRGNNQSPANYVLSKFQTHRVVLVGEHHWIRHDVELVLSVIPRLREAGVHTLAFEILDAKDQAAIDRLVGAAEWMPELAMSLQRAQAWPYQEYLQILHTVWKANQSSSEGERALKLLAIGPGSDWRERLLPIGKTYDRFMAERILEQTRDGSRILVYGGLHHVFTRFYQPELPRANRVEAFMDRMGNILWRKLGEDVFTIVLHRPMQCKQGDDAWGHCLPVSGAIDCAASALGSPVGFDVVGSPFADLGLDPKILYALGYPAPRLVDLTDGYIWFRPIEDYEGVSLIPLADFAPDAESLEEVFRRNPFTDDEIGSREQLETLWATEARSLEDIHQRFRWGTLESGDETCKQR